ncbi:hypothetical protein FRB94_012977 [Tulasnella sp. JGI-2019a]|nr:hypothetical protein FRB94_012977 [Tulasnella sp. JGI-2019a]
MLTRLAPLAWERLAILYESLTTPATKHPSTYSPELSRPSLATRFLSTHESFQATSDYILRISLAVQTAKEITSTTAAHIHKEITRLRHLEHKSKMGIKNLAWA